MTIENVKTTLENMVSEIKNLVESNAEKIKNIELYEECIEKVNDDLFTLVNYKTILEEIGLNDENKKRLNEIIDFLELNKNSDFLINNEPMLKELRKDKALNKFIDLIKQRIEESNVIIKNNQKLLNDSTELENVLKSIENNEYINTENLLVTLNKCFKQQDVFKILECIGYYNVNLSIKNYKDLSESIKNVKVSGIDESVLSKILTSFNYNIEKLNKETKEKLLRHCEKEKLENILNTLESLNIRLDSKFLKDGKYADQVKFELLYKADTSIIEDIKELAEKCGISDYKIFISRNVSLLVRRGKKGEKHTPSEPGNTNKSLASGFDDFKENIELFESLGYDIKDLYNNTPQLLFYPSNTYKKNINLLQQYGIDVSKYHGTFKITGLKGSNAIKVVERFIELDEFNYLVNNNSAFNWDYDSDKIYRLYKCVQEDEKKSYRLERDNGTKYVFDGKITMDTQKVTTEEGISVIPNPITKETVSKEYHLVNQDREFSLAKKVEEDYQDKLDGTGKLIDENEIDKSVLQIIEENYKSKFAIAYEVNGKYFSKYKVLRLLTSIGKNYTCSKEELILFVLTYNSLLTSEELENIKTTINGKGREI